MEHKSVAGVLVLLDAESLTETRQPFATLEELCDLCARAAPPQHPDRIVLQTPGERGLPRSLIFTYEFSLG